MRTKTFLLASLMCVFLLICSAGINAQTTKSSLDQLKLMQQDLGTWQANVDKDTVVVWETQQYGKAFITNESLLVKGIKSPSYVNNISFDPEAGKIHGFVLWNNGSYSTWSGLWTTEKKMNGELFQTYKPETLWGKFELVYETPANMTFTIFTLDGKKSREYKFKKVK
jgi:hypothetical protein